MEEHNIYDTTGAAPETPGSVTGHPETPEPAGGHPETAMPVTGGSENDGPGQQPDYRLSLVDLVYGLLFAPTATFQKISARPPLGYAFIIFTAVTLIGTLISVWVTPVNPELVSDMPPEMTRMMQSMMPYIGLLGALFGFLNWFILAGIFQLLSEFLAGRGKALGVFTVLGLAELPQVFSGPIYLLTGLAGKSVLSTFLMVSSGLLIFIWRFVLIVIGLRETHGYSTGRALITVLAPGLVLFLVAVVAVVALVGMMVPIFGNIPG